MRLYFIIYLVGIPVSTFIILLSMKQNPKKYGNSISGEYIWGAYLSSFLWPLTWLLISIMLLVEVTALCLQKRKEK